MKKFVVVLLAVALLVGCGQESEVKDSIREAAKDPTSVMFMKCLQIAISEKQEISSAWRKSFLFVSWKGLKPSV